MTHTQTPIHSWVKIRNKGTLKATMGPVLENMTDYEVELLHRRVQCSRISRANRADMESIIYKELQYRGVYK